MTTTPRPRRAHVAPPADNGVRARRAAGAGMAQNRDSRGVQAPEPQKMPQYTTPTVSGPRKWCLWFGVRPGPPRSTTVTIAGQKVKIRRRRLEFPPTGNNVIGNPFVLGRWVKEWRQVAKKAAQDADIPYLGRVRISAVMKRRAIGTADEDNDRQRCKHLVDGIRDAGVIANDTRRFVVYGPCTEERAGPDGPGILLVVEALERGAHGSEEGVG